MSWRADLRRLAGRSWHERGLVAEALLCLCAARVAIAVLPFRRVQQLLHLDEVPLEAAEPSPDGGQPPAEIERIGWAVRAAARRAPRFVDTCLAQSLAGASMLSRRSLPGTVHLGVAKDREGGFRAHSWLASGNAVLTGAAGRDAFEEITRVVVAPRERRHRRSPAAKRQ